VFLLIQDFTLYISDFSTAHCTKYSIA